MPINCHKTNECFLKQQSFNSLCSQTHNADTHHKANCCTLALHLIPSTLNHTMSTHTHTHTHTHTTMPPVAHSIHQTCSTLSHTQHTQLAFILLVK